MKCTRRLYSWSVLAVCFFLLFPTMIYAGEILEELEVRYAEIQDRMDRLQLKSD